MFDFFFTNLFWTQGKQLLVVLSALALAGLLSWRPLFLVSATLLVFCLFFFRNPTRVCVPALRDSSVLVCPADGKVVSIDYDETGGIEGQFYQKIAIFLSPFDVHVNWLPTAGTVERIAYRKGAFTLAYLPKSSDKNERNDIYIRTDNGQLVCVRQIAGILVRRICWWVGPGDVVKAGHKFGMIRFSSRVELLLPKNVKVAVGVGQHVFGGQTVIGHWR